MKKISGNYVYLNKEVPFNIEIPSQWDELDSHTFARVVEVLTFQKADKFTISVSLLALIFGSKNWTVLDALPNELKTQLIPCTNFILDEKPPLKNYFPELNINKKPCIAPDVDLSNIGFGEWCFAHQFYIYYSITKDVQWLDKLIATIYRPKDQTQDPDSATFSGDEREKFNDNLIDKRSLSVAHLEPYLKLAVFAWFTIAVKAVAELRPHVFPQAKPESQPQPDFEPQPQPDPDLSRTWLTIFRELLGPKWGTTEQLKFTSAMFVLEELEDRHIAFEEAKKGN